MLYFLLLLNSFYLISAKKHIDENTEVAACFGSDATAAGIRFQFATRIKGDVKIIRDARARGIDCKDIKLESFGGKNGRTFRFLKAHFFKYQHLVMLLMEF